MPIKKISEFPPGHEYADHLTSPPVALKSQPVQAVTVVEKKKSKEEKPYAVSEKVENAMPGAIIPPDRLYHVHISGKRTFNLGNYESSTISVGITVPCTLESLPEMFGFGETYISDKIQGYEKMINDSKGGASAD